MTQTAAMVITWLCLASVVVAQTPDAAAPSPEAEKSGRSETELVGAADSKPRPKATEPDAAPEPEKPNKPADAPKQSKPAENSGPKPESAPEPSTDEAASKTGLAEVDPEHARLLDALKQRLEQAPPPDADPEEVQHRLDQIIVDATALIEATSDGPLQVTARSLQLQAIYLRVSRWPSDPLLETRLLQMDRSAQKLASLKHPQAAPLGDFWQMMVAIVQVNRSGAEPAIRRQRFTKLLEQYLKKHPKGAPADSVRQMLAELAPKPEPSKPVPAEKTEPDSPPTDAAFELGKPEPQPGGVVHYTIKSRYQLGTNLLRVLEPSELPAPADRLIVFVLPVEPGIGESWGDPLEHIRKLKLHEKHRVVFVMPTFHDLPWYADHPTKQGLRQDSYMAKAVLPAIDRLYPAQKPNRVLLGFSKSGWGALSLLLRYPARFKAAAVWDAPLMKTAPDSYGMGPIFGTLKNFKKYQFDHTLRERARLFKDEPRIVLMGYDHFREDMQRAHSLLEQLQIPHVWQDGPQRKHHWASGWVAPALEALLDLDSHGRAAKAEAPEIEPNPADAPQPSP